MLESFYYGRAFANALSRRLGELVVDVASELGRSAAERPQRLIDFQVSHHVMLRLPKAPRPYAAFVIRCECLHG